MKVNLLRSGERPRRVQQERASEAALAQEGWERRFEADATREQELVELYTSLGFEVMVRGIATDNFGPDCEGCALTVGDRYIEIYTRRHPA